MLRKRQICLLILGCVSLGVTSRSLKQQAVAKCGNGFREQGEQCDDENLSNGDGCSNRCQVENEYFCYGGEAGTSRDFCLKIPITGSLEECEKFASQFPETCTDDRNVDGFNFGMQMHSCTGTGQCMYQSQGDTCWWGRQLCVTCRVDYGVTFIRIRTNSLPNHCFKLTFDSPFPTTNNVDFEVAFQPRGSVFETLKIGSIDQAICESDSQSDGKIQYNSYFRKFSGDTSGIAGIALNGIPIFSGTGGNYDGRQDVFAPTIQSGMAPSNVDTCLGTTYHSGEFGTYHYHSYSPCITQQSTQTFGELCKDNESCSKSVFSSSPLVSYIQEKSQQKKLQAVGIAKDGHIIYGPYKNDGTTWQPCEVDACNGVYINGVYAYVSTFFHPYTVGCFGPAPKTSAKASCTANPRVCSFASQYGINIVIFTISIVLLFFTL